MVIISTEYSELEDYNYDNSIITIGSFDGLHLGHQEIFHKMSALKLELPSNSLNNYNTMWRARLNSKLNRIKWSPEKGELFISIICNQDKAGLTLLLPKYYKNHQIEFSNEFSEIIFNFKEYALFEVNQNNECLIKYRLM